MVSSRTASAPPQKKCKKKGLPHYFNATAPFCVEHFIQEVPLNNSNQMFRPAVYPAGRDS